LVQTTTRVKYEDLTLRLWLSTDGRTLVSGSEDKTLKVWDLTTYELKASFVADAAVLGVDLASTDHIIAGDQRGQIHWLRLRLPQLAELERYNKTQAAANVAPVVKEKELTAQEWFELGYKTNGVNAKIHYYTEAIRRKWDYAEAYNNRGIPRYATRDLDGAIKDYTVAICLKPDYALAYYNRGLAFYDKGDLDGALKDYTEAIRLKPDYANAYYARAQVWKRKADEAAAIADFQKYLDLGEAIRSRNQAAVEMMIPDLKQEHYLKQFE
jgi:tetratricopeptide (TPR) repeat protein